MVENHCPRCQTIHVRDLGDNIYCPSCKLTFYKTFLRFLEDHNILSNEELEGLVANVSREKGIELFLE
jgi:uncharacterized Zn finger protein (UPF0148 family)